MLANLITPTGSLRGIYILSLLNERDHATNEGTASCLSITWNPMVIYQQEHFLYAEIKIGREKTMNLVYRVKIIFFM